MTKKESGQKSQEKVKIVDIKESLPPVKNKLEPPKMKPPKKDGDK